MACSIENGLVNNVPHAIFHESVTLAATGWIYHPFELTNTHVSKNTRNRWRRGHTKQVKQSEREDLDRARRY